MPVNRKLVAVVMADVVGYSRLMERDEAGTHRRLREVREKLFDPKIAEHGGRTVHTSGDGMLLEFPSATSALRCAVEVQREMGVHNLYLAPGERLELRIGINLGDIIVEGDDIIGDGVNVAQRLETLAEPGGICVASAIWEQVHEDLGIEFVDAGEQRVKNISKPIHVYRVALGKGAGVRTDREASLAASLATSSRWTRRSRALITVGGLVILVAGVLIAWQFSRQSAPVATSSGAAPAARSIMVVPFRAPSDEAELRSLANSLTVDLTRALADSVRDATVIAPEVAASVAASGGDHRALGRQANVHYLIEGEVRMLGSDVLVSTRLIDAAVGKDLGGDRNVVARSSLGSGGDLLTKRLAYGAFDLFDNAERRRTGTLLPPNATAQDLVDRARNLADRADTESLQEARKLLDEAIRREPSLAVAWAQRSDLAFTEWNYVDFTADNARLVADMERDSLRAVTLDDRDPLAWMARAEALLAQARFDAALAAVDRAQKLDPSHYFLLRGAILGVMGRSDETLKLIASRNATLDRNDPVFLSLSCVAHLNLGEYQQAIADCELAATGIDAPWVYSSLTAAYAQSGDMANATKAREELMRRVPTFTISRFVARKSSNNPVWLEQQKSHVIPGWRKAGVPE